MYDGVPILSKWISVSGNSAVTVSVYSVEFLSLNQPWSVGGLETDTITGETDSCKQSQGLSFRPLHCHIRLIQPFEAGNSSKFSMEITPFILTVSNLDGKAVYWGPEAFNWLYVETDQAHGANVTWGQDPAATVSV